MATARPAGAGDVTLQEMAPVVAASTTGTAVEWYDFFLYGTMATLVFPKLFFPESNQVVGTLLSFFTFLVGFIARPIGGAIFGHLGDRIGRKSTLIVTLLLMGIATLLVGFMPGFVQIGILAPIIVSVLRFCQGLGVGGEWGGSVLLSMEYGYKRNRGFWAAWPQMGVPIGLILSTLIVKIFSGGGTAFFDPKATGWWNGTWRIPFFVSALLIVIGLYIRLRILETPLFAKVQQQDRVASSPIAEAFRRST
ncbi:MAG TPA: MFS transporter, partial [Ktedonobacterales bacterium]|nr:MFS transporter [Ktedonobacterales bacterium]